jgi:ketosteroid isomerase-like protein
VSENAEKLRAFYELFNRRDFDGAVQYMHPEVEIRPAIGGELDSSRLYRGRDGGRELFEWIADGFEVRVDIEEVLEAPGHRILLVELWNPRGRQGIETPLEVFDIYRFRDGLMVQVDGFRDRAEALDAAGLPG